jgi:adenine-specific DNA glycosylase
MAAQAILDRGYGKPVQQVDANISEGAVRYVEIPRKAESADAWLQQQTPALANAEPAKDKVN